MSKITAILLAAGKGRRMKSDVQKQYMLLNGKPLIWYSLDTFEKSPVDEIILVVGPGEVEICRKNIVDAFGFKKVSQIVEGGEERYDSVYEGLKAAEDADYVLIHDGARPFVTEKIIADNIETAERERACATGMPVKDTIKMVDVDNYAIFTPTRDHVWLVQTPQTFEYPLIREGYEKIMEKREKEESEDDRFEVTDDAMIVERLMRTKVKLIRGSYENIKITTPEDLVTAQGFVEIQQG